MTPDDLPFKIVIPSHGRPQQILKNPLYPLAHVVVRDEATADAYRATADKAGVTPGPFHVTGPLPNISSIRQWILDNLWDADEPFIFTTDDDLVYVRPTMVWRTERITDAADILAIIQEGYNSAVDAGAGLFGWSNNGSPQRRNAKDPWFFRTYVMGQVGIIDRELRYDPRLYLMEDIDFSLLSMTRSKIIWNDNRWYWYCGPQWSKGGMSASRTTDRLVESRDIMNRKYGAGTIKTLKNKARNPYRFTMNV